MTPYYSHAGITIYHGDCREILPQLDLGPSAAGITDPPYGVGIKYGPAYNDDPKTYWEWFVPCVDTLRARLAPLVFTHRVKALAHLSGWDWIGVWNKPDAFGARVGNSCVLPHWEPIFMYGIHGLGPKSSYLGDVLTFNPVNNGNGIADIGREKWASGDFEYHPCPKPEPMYRDLLSAFAQKSGVVVDPFCGSGTTLRVAKNLGRDAIGIEINERYCEEAAARLSQEVLDFSGEVSV